MLRGKVKWYNEIKGYGFIATDDGEDIFVHRTGLVKSFSGLETDQIVEFEAEKSDKGLLAVNVKVI